MALVLAAYSGAREPWGVTLDWAGASGMVVDAQGNVTVALGSGGGATGAVEQYGPDGQRRFAQRLDFDVQGIAAASTAGFVVTGSRELTLGEPGSLVAGVDGHEVSWTTALQAEASDDVESVLLARFVISDERGLWVAGQESRRSTAEPSIPNPEPPPIRPFLARLDADGEVQWQQTLGEGPIYPMGLAPGADGGAVLGVRLNGASLDVAGDRYEQSQVATLLTGFSAEGEALFSREVGESLDDEMTSVTHDEGGTLYVTGTRTRHDSAVTANGIFVSATSPDGDVELRADIDQGIQMDEPRVAVRPGGELVVASSYSDEHGGGHLLIVELDTEGREQRRRTFANGGHAIDVAIGPDGSLLLLGSFQGEVDIGPVHLATEQPYASYLVQLAE